MKANKDDATNLKVGLQIICERREQNFLYPHFVSIVAEFKRSP